MLVVDGHKHTLLSFDLRHFSGVLPSSSIVVVV